MNAFVIPPARPRLSPLPCAGVPFGVLSEFDTALTLLVRFE